MTNIIIILVCILMFFFAFGGFYTAVVEKKERRKIEKELNEVNRNEKQCAEIISNANKTKADARTGDHNVDIKYMADKLHDYANK